MIDINELRRLAQEATPGPWKVGQYLGSPRQFVIHMDVGDKGRGSDVAFTSASFGNDETIANASLIAAANPATVIELLDRLEAAEKDIALKERIIDSLGSELNAVANERDALRAELADLRSSMTFRTSLIGRIEAERNALHAKIKAMEQQEPVAWLHETRRDSDVVTNAVKHVWGKAVVGALAAYSIPLYLAPGAQPAPSFADAYQGAMEEVAIWKRRALEAEDLNRKFIAEINGPTYMGEPAQPAPSVPEGWQLVPTAESRHPGIYKMLGALHAADNTPGMSEWESYRAMLSAAPEAKP